MSTTHSNHIVKIGLIGCGEVAQVVHIPTLLHMREFYLLTYLCDISSASLQHCSATIPSPHKKTHSPAELCASDDVNAVLVANSEEYLAEHSILGLQNGKHVLVEKPLAFIQRDIRVVIEVEMQSRGRVMVGYMRRLGGLDKVLYARVRDIVGPNSFFVDQSVTFPNKFTDFAAADTADKDERGREMVKTALETECGGVDVTPETTLIVLFKYPGFTVLYESGIDNVPRLDLHIEVYGRNKTVRVQYDTPYDKGLPVMMYIIENVDGA
ncbi:NAD(P)-binding protein [Byssothecium circinans]|uniref:NAD(P)-binding protein n=1 Tax=Byssothecium circinans TaxID=147558 RepID=A0A6A5U9L3_9PLEO|nr:NAD(P)-binding protein [Byssothecium circinans]